MNINSGTYNKNHKYACGWTLMNSRPFAWRYMHSVIFILFVIFSSSTFSQIHVDEASWQISRWNEILRNEISGYLLDTEVIELGKKNGLTFEYTEKPSTKFYDYEDHELIAEIGTFKSSGIDCKYTTIYARIILNEFKQTTGSFSVGRGIKCIEGI